MTLVVTVPGSNSSRKVIFCCDTTVGVHFLPPFSFDFAVAVSLMVLSAARIFFIASPLQYR